MANFEKHREKVLAHAAEQLVSQGRQHPSDLLTLYKKFLKIENHRLRLKHYAGGGGREIARQRADMVDIVLRHLHESAVESLVEKEPQLALVAIGGYGRGELNPFSDVDIMFLHGGSQMSPQTGSIIEAILYMLWDVGFKVGHSTRSIPGAMEQANADMLSKTALLEARFIGGDRELYESFRTRFEEKCVRGHEKEYIAQRVANQAERHAKHGSTVYVQEPNIKAGCGSLRDYHNLLWISFFQRGISTSHGLVEAKLLAENDRRKLDRAYDFLLRVRTELHYLCRRGTDTLSLVHQLPVATKLEYPQKNPLRRIEAFMRDYYQHARVIFRFTETLSARLCMSEEESARSGLVRFLMRRKKNEHFDGFFIAQGLLYPESREIFRDDPFRMMRAFQHAQQRKVGFSPELQTLVRRRLHLVDRTYCYARSSRETFKAILSRKGEVGRMMRLMHECDFLGRYLPEFGELTCLVQHEFFHRYTVDEHTLVCLEKLDALVDTPNPRLRGYRELFLRHEAPFVLYLATILHDAGKASNARYHAEASAILANRVAARLQLRSEQRKELIFLVDNHLLLSSTAQRRNLEDPATISEFANVVRSQANLDALMLLTLADGMGIGDDHTWSDWKESLVWHLYRSTTQYFKDGVVFFHERAMEREENRRAVTRKLNPSYEAEINAHFLYMPDSYFQAFDVHDISGHIRLFRTFFERRALSEVHALAPALRWVPRTERGHSELWVCTWDRRHLLAKIAGALAAAHLNILSADIFTRGDNLALDVFRVCDTNFQAVTTPRETEQVERILTEALAGEDYDFEPLLKAAQGRPSYQLSQELEFPTQIMIDSSSHPVYTLVDIQTPDRLGLLYHILKAFGEAGLNIALSRIATEKGAAIDSFYVVNAEGRKIKDHESILRLQKLLERVTEKG